MHAYLQELVNRVRHHENDADAFDRLVGELRGQASPADVLELLRAGADRVRRAALQSAQGRTEPDIVAAASRLAHDSSAAVREALAAAMEAAPHWLPNATLETLLADGSEGVRQVAARAARWCPDLQGVVLGRLSQDSNWRVRLNLAETLGHL